MKMIKVMAIFGTRPEAIKMAPVIKELQSRSEIDVKICVSAQHREMLDQVMSIFGLVSDYDLDIMKSNQTLFDITSNALLKIGDVLLQEEVDLVLVHGDTTTTFAASLAAFYNKIKVGHVEAGLRTYDKYSPFPEEMNRLLTSNLCDIHFAPTKISKENLLRENKSDKNIIVTGNTAIDALKLTVSDNYSNSITEWISKDKMILLTAHRRENLGSPMKNMFSGIKKFIDENKGFKILFPIHMNPKVREIANDVFANNPNIKLIEPLDVYDFHNLMNKAHIILTDSGGIQEEAPSLGKPVLVLRDTTERPEGIDAGTLKLVGTSAEKIYEELTKLVSDNEYYNTMAKATNPYGDGKASQRIANYIIDYFKEENNV